jgi:hypothetical protein
MGIWFWWNSIGRVSESVSESEEEDSVSAPALKIRSKNESVSFEFCEGVKTGIMEKEIHE